MAPVKRALLIAVPSFGLTGPLNDVQLMSDILAKQGFEITTCYDQEASRKGILDSWRLINSKCQPDDTLVIYYSGHGGIVEDSSKQEPGNEAGVEGVKHTPWRYQFLVPIDFRPDENTHVGDEVEAVIESEKEFTGILDVEVKQLRAEASRRTRNVTIILDCCHSGAMSRHPICDAVPRSLPKVQHAALSSRYNRLRANAQIAETGGGEDAVTIVAAAAAETAWEYCNHSGQRVGSMTQAFVDALNIAWKNYEKTGESISWRTMMVRVSEMVNAQFPQQHPHVEGPDKRLLFSLEESVLNALLLRVDENSGLNILQAGRLSGVREGNVYGLWPLEAEQRRESTRLGTATVKNVTGSKASTELDLLPEKTLGAKDTALAVLEKETLPMWPIAYPDGLEILSHLVNASTNLCTASSQQDSLFAEIGHEGQQLVLKDSQGLELASRNVITNDPDSLASASRYIFSRAETLAKSQHLRSLICDNPDEQLDHQLNVIIGTVKDGKKDRVIEQDGSGHVVENDRLYVSLKNRGTRQLYASVFNVNAWGKISLISNQRPRGIDLPANRSSDIGSGDFGTLEGLPISWPNGIPKTRPVNECLVIIVTDSPLNLTCLADSSLADARGSGSGSSTLEQVAFSLATGFLRDVGSQSRSTKLNWDLIQINFALRPLDWKRGEGYEVRLEDIPEPDDFSFKEIPLYPPFFEQPEAKSVGGIIRKIKGIEPFIWVVNKHDEEILVVVSKHRPRRLLTEVGVEASATSAGLNFSTTTFNEPIGKKTLAPWKEQGPNGGSVGRFPLWSLKEGFAVVSIFRGPQMELYIENDQVPIGCTAYFSNMPNMETFDHKGKPILNGPEV
ncbi:hypothetical protein FPRO03_08327 [Fusarium proliferatum]|nr:hypothetical protein FPRO03_08327 [Fusarium proliferatum]